MRHYLTVAPCLLAACTLQHFDDRPLDGATLMAAYEARTLSAPALGRFMRTQPGRADQPWPLSRWDFSALTLAAFHYSPVLETARKRAATAQAAVTTAGQVPNPLLQLPLAYGTNPKQGDSPLTFGIGLDLPFETAGKRRYRTAQAARLSDAARLDLGLTAWRVRAQLRTQWLDLQHALRREAALAGQVRTQREIAAMLEKRFALGAASAGELGTQRIALLQVEADLRAEHGRAEAARAGLAAVIGVPAAALNSVTLDLKSTDADGLSAAPIAAPSNASSTAPPTALTAASSTASSSVTPIVLPTGAARQAALLGRADFQAALARYAASQAALQLEIANQYPDIHLGPAYTFDQGVNKFAFGVTGIVLPVLNQNQGPIAEARARRDEVAAQVVQVQAEAIGELDRASAAYRAASAARVHSETLAAAADLQYARARQAFAAGQADRLTLALARQENAVAQRQRDDAEAALRQARGQVEDALQTTLDGASEILSGAAGPLGPEAYLAVLSGDVVPVSRPRSSVTESHD